MSEISTTDNRVHDASNMSDRKSCPLLNHGCDETHEVFKKICSEIFAYVLFLPCA